MIAVFKKEWNSYFRSSIGFLFSAVLLFFLGVFFTYYNMSSGSPYLAYAISSVLFFMLLLIPILTMRVWSEERKQKTDQLLFTSPLQTGKVIWGKFLAVESVLLFCTVIFGCYMFLPAIYGKVPFAENVLALVAFFLFGTACISIGFFISSITESQVIAAVLTYAVLLICAFMPNITGLFGATGTGFADFLDQTFDITIHLNALMNGIIDLKAIAYYLSITGLMLFFTWFIIQSRRKNMFYKITGTCKSMAMLVLAVVLAGGISVLLSGLPGTVTEYDITSEQMYSLTDTTKELLGQLDEDITIYVLSDEADADQALKLMLGRYEALSRHIQVIYKDPLEYPEFSTFYTEENLETGSMIVVGQERNKIINYSDCYEVSYQMDYTTYEYYEVMTGFDGEGQITAGISYVISEDIPVIYELSGHEEYELPDEFENRVSKMNIEMKRINLMQYDRIPEDASAILICGPIIDYTKEDMQKIKEYLEDGGRGIFFTAFSTESLTEYEKLFLDYGVQIAEGVVFEQDEYYYKEYPYYLMPVVLDTSVTDELYRNNRVLLMAQCRGITTVQDYDTDAITITPLLMTSDSAYSKVNVTTMQTMDKEEGDLSGPFYLSARIEKEQGNGAVTKMILIGTEFMSDAELNSYTADANYEYMLSCISEIVDEIHTISVPVKQYELSGILMNSGVVNVAAIVMIIVIPGGLLVAGIMIVILRRRKHKQSIQN